MKIYTKTGDKGQTSLFDNTRVDKDSIRVESYGTIDELNSSLGFAKNFVDVKEVKIEIKDLQKKLFNVAGELATVDSDDFSKKIKKDDVDELEEIIDKYLEKMGENANKFIVPGSNKGSAALHMSRAICRRAERRVTTLASEENIRPELQKYINRLSDVIYTLARYTESDVDYME